MFGLGMGSLGADTGAGIAPALALDFLTGALDPRITFTRGSNATLFDSTGTLAWAPNNAIRNNTMQGAAVPSTFPTNWQNVIVAGLTATVVGTGTQNGITYLDVRVNGTSSVSTFYNLVPDILVAGASGQTWTGSFWASLVAGSLTNTNPFIEIRESDAAQGFLTNTVAGIPITSTLTRYSLTRTLNNASTAFVSVRFVWQVTNGLPVDFTLRIGMPQLERGSTATAVNATSGTAYYGPRFDYNPSTLAAQGLLIEEQRTNSIRNNTMQGAVAGTPGTAPTNWLIPTPSNGLSRQIVGTGTESGINYVDVRYSGTTSAASLTAIYWESATQVAAASGQTWTNSVYVALVGGSTANTTGVVVGIDENSGAGGFLTGSSTTFVPSAGALSGKRVSHTRTLTNASTAFVWPYVFFSYGNGAAIDITLRIGLPQLEQGAFATSVIPTTTAAATRSADVASVNTLTPWFNQPEGSLYVEWQSNPTSYARYLVSIEQAATSATRIDININSVNAVNPRTVVSGAAVTSLTGGTYTGGGVAKIVFGYKSADYASSFNGAAAVTATTAGALPSSLAIMYLGSITGGTQVNGYLRRITYYPVRLANAQLQAITT